MANFTGLNYGPVIKELRAQRDILMQALKKIDEAVSSLEALQQLIPTTEHQAAATETTPSLTVLSPPAVDAPEAPEQDKTARGLPFRFAEEVAQIIDTLSGEITQPHVLNLLLGKYPEVKPKAKEMQLGARIAGELRKYEEKKVLYVIKKSYSNFPTIYGKVSELSEHP